jgi:glycosyltransferase involved in cell wall biosynthesis
MNVMLVAPWDQEFGGVASVVGNLARRLERRGHHVVFVHPGESTRRRHRRTVWGFPGYTLNLRSPFVRAHPLKSVIGFIVYLAVTLYQLRAAIRTHSVQVVNIHYPTEAFVYFAILRWLLPIRLVVSVHGADLFPAGQPPRRYPWSLTLMIASADALIAPSRAFLRDCLAVFPKAAGKGGWIHNGIDMEELRVVDETLPTSEWQPYLLCIAAHNHKKALDVLLQAFARLEPTSPRPRLLLVGDGPLRREHEAHAKALGVDDRVTFLGWRTRREVARLLRDCTMFVLPSRAEPFGIVVAEALACRKAVVASAVGGIREIVEHGRSGLLV